MKQFKSLICIILVLAMLLGNVPVHAHAEEHQEPDQIVTSGEETTTPTEPEETVPSSPEETVPEEQEIPGEEALQGEFSSIPFRVNPRYEDLYTPEDFALSHHQPDYDSAYFTQATTFLSLAQAGKVIRDGMKARQETIKVDFISNHSNSQAAGNEVMLEATRHTGNPLEGDYLEWQYAGWSGSAYRSFDSATQTYRYRCVFNVEYYTTAEQEAELTVAVNNLLASLNLQGKSDYQKIYAVYDYICENIRYDYANLDNINYTLKHTAYAALMHKTAVCQGYALLFYRLMLELGIDNRLIAGMGGSGANAGPHGWNIVELDGLYYNVDSTWDEGVDDYIWFLDNTWEFIDHERYMEYDTIAFHNEYPMAEESYQPGVAGKIDPYIYAGLCGVEEYNFLNAAWLLGRNGVLYLEGEGPIYDSGMGDSSRLAFNFWSEEITGIEVGEGITYLGTFSFYDFPVLKQVTLPSTLTEIAYDCFRECPSLTTVNLPEGLTQIGERGFINCTALKEIKFPTSLTKIGNSAFTDCDSLTALDFEGVNVHLGRSAFNDCDGLTDLRIHAGMSVSDACFRDCDKLRSVWFDGTTVPESCFAECPALKTITLTDRVTTISYGAFENADALTEVVIPASVTSLTGFRNCSNLRKVTLPDGLTEIGYEAFAGCNALAEMNLPQSLQIIGEHAFQACAFRQIDLPDTLTTIRSNAFASCANLTEVVIPAGVTYLAGFNNCTNLERVVLNNSGTIGTYAFSGCSKLSDIVIPEGITEIGMNAFGNCRGLTEITIPSTVTKIGGNAFYYCENLQTVILDNSGSIGAYAFADCQKLKSVTIGENITEITTCAFDGDTALTEIYFRGDALSIADNAFEEVTATAYYPTGNGTWTVEKRVNYGGSLTWEPYGEASCEHDYIAVITDPTCRDKGYTTYTCSKCGENFATDYVDPLGHDMGQWYADTEPSCKRGGVGRRDCTRCDHCETKGLDAMGHQFMGGACIRCGETAAEGTDYSPYYSDFEWEALRLINRERVKKDLFPLTGCALLQQASDIRARELDELLSYTRPDGSGFSSVLSEVGISVNYAGEMYAASQEAQYTPAQVVEYWLNNDNCNYILLDASVRHAGLGYYEGSSINWEQIAAYSNWESNSDMTIHLSRGYTFPLGTGVDNMGIYAVLENRSYGKCFLPIMEEFVTGYDPNLGGTQNITVQVLGFTRTVTVILRDCSHVYEPVITEPTCTEGGYTTYTCADCGDCYITDEVPALGHDWDEGIVTKEPTEEETGTRTHTCKRCGETEDREIPAIDHVHKYEPVVTAPTCTEEGYTTHTCRCGDSYKDSYVPAAGHNMSQLVVTKEADCLNPGEEYSECVNCDYEETHEIPALGHDHAAEVVEPTCTEAGYTAHTCERCGDSYITDEVPALGHDWDEGIVTKEPTEEETGIRTHTCKRCGGTEDREIPAIDHVHKYEPVVTAPTCTEEGYTTHTCRCGDSYKDSYVPAIGHNMSQLVVTKEADCLTPGEEYSECVNCDYEEFHEIPALGHDHAAEVVEPTCTEAGYTAHTCERCGDSYVTDEVPALGHDWDEGIVTKEPTEEETGTRTHTCKRCGGTEDREIPTIDHVHKYEPVVTAPTCTEEGYTTHTCRCGDSYKDSYVPAAGHNMSQLVVTKEADCLTPGEEYSKCVNCDYEEFHEIPALGHDHATEVVEPTCTEAGYTAHTCTRCGDSYVTDEVPALGHDWDEGIVTKEPTEEETGTRTHTCKRCGGTEDREIPAIDHVHKYEPVVTAPTCTEEGYTTHTCRCGDSYKDSYVPAAGHNMSQLVVTKEADCLNPGEEYSKCVNCDYEEFHEIPSLGHDWDNSGSGDPTCKRCGEIMKGYPVYVNLAELAGDEALPEMITSVDVDGVTYPVIREGNGFTVMLPTPDATNLVLNIINKDATEDVHSQYPVGMRVWILKYENGAYTATYIPEFDDLLTYAGTSIRIVGKKGIRMITKVAKSTKTALTGKNGLAGYTLVEYGTALGFAHEVDPALGLTLGQEYTRYNYAYLKGKADAVFKHDATHIQYTNVLVGFTNEQCRDDIAMRSYIILADAEGNQITIYSGVINRSIGYVALQNKTVFKPKTAAYEYVWDIIHFVYGEQYDADFKK